MATKKAKENPVPVDPEPEVDEIQPIGKSVESSEKIEKRRSKNIEDSMERIAIALENGLDMLETIVFHNTLKS